MENELKLPEKYKEDIEMVIASLREAMEGMVSGYEKRIGELEARCEELEQENIELKYKLRQLSNDLKNLSEKIAIEFLRRAESSIEEVEKFNQQ